MPQTPDSSASSLGLAKSSPPSPWTSPIDTSTLQGHHITVPTSAASWDPRALLQPRARVAEPPKPAQNGSLDSAVGSPTSRGNTPNLTNGNSVVFQFTSQNGTPAYTGTTTSTTSSPGSDHRNHAHRGAGDFIERMNNVQDRAAIPQPKRRRLDENDPSKDPSSVQVRGGGGILGSYVKDKREEASPAGSASAMTVDLTSGTVLL
jgi:hypothetical protein